MAASHQLLQILTYNVMVQKYGVCIEVGVVKIVAYSRANQWQFFYLVVFSFSFLASASQFTNVPLGKRTVWASICSRALLSFSSSIPLLLSILTRILSRREFARILFPHSPACVKTRRAFDYPNISSAINVSTNLFRTCTCFCFFSFFLCCVLLVSSSLILRHLPKSLLLQTLDFKYLLILNLLDSFPIFDFAIFFHCP